MREYLEKNVGDNNVAPVPSGDRKWTPPRDAVRVSGGPPAVASANYFPSVMSPGGATNGQSKEQK